jgi:PKD repeat protein
VTVLFLGGLVSIPSAAAVHGSGVHPASPAASAAPAPAASAAPDPAIEPQWFNVTGNISAHSGGNVPAVGFGSSLAYDPLLSELVLFNGCSETVCPSNYTWVYNGFSWTNITSTLTTSPSPREGAGMAFDPTFGGVILFGGWNTDSVTLNDTWLFTASGWSNLTATIGPSPYNWAYGGMAWDPGLDAIVVADGCYDAACIPAEEYSITLLLTHTGWSYIEPGPGGGLTYIGYNSLAYDYSSNELVEFGGYAYEVGDVNYTYTMNSSETWVNVTNDDAGCVAGICSTPQGRVSTAMTWDGQLGGALMAEGYNGTTDTWLNDSWLFTDGAWYSTSIIGHSAPSNFCASAWPSMATVSDNVAPFITGGYSPDGAGCASTEWVFEIPPQATLTVSPHPVDVGTSVTYTAGWTLGTGSGIVAGWNLTYGNGHTFSPTRAATGVNTSGSYTRGFPYTYPASGTFSASVTWNDFFYIGGTSPVVSLTVNPAIVATITASATTIKAGGAVTFSTSPTGGSGTYSYAWTFGDGTTSAAQGPPAHTFSKAGTYVVNLTVTDTLGGKASDSVSITVNAAPSTGPSLSGSTLTYLVIGIVVVLVAIIAVVLLMRRRKKPMAAQPWQPGAPPAGSSPPAGAMSEAPTPPPSPPPS